MQNRESSSTTPGTLLRALNRNRAEWAEFVPFGGAPKVTSVFGLQGASGHLELFAIAEDGTLYHNWRDETAWRGWEPDFLGAPKVTSVFGVAGASGHTEMFIIGRDNGTLYHNWLDSRDWHRWEPNFQNAPAMRIVTGATFGDFTDIFAISSDRTLLYMFYSKKEDYWRDNWEKNFTGNVPKVTQSVFTINDPWDGPTVFAVAGS